MGELKQTRRHTRATAAFAVAAVLLLVTGGCAWIVRSSVVGVDSSDTSFDVTVSGNGRWVAFRSAANNLLAPGKDNNGQNDVFAYDRQTGATTLISVATDGTQGDLGSFAPAITPSGRYIAFQSQASTLNGAGGDTNGVSDVYVRDRDTDNDGIFDEPGAVLTQRVSLSSTGGEATGASDSPTISDDGTKVAFRSLAANVVSGDTNATYDIFIRNRSTLTNTRASVNTGGGQGTYASGEPAFSGDGNTIAFDSYSGFDGAPDGFEGLFARNLTSGVTKLMSQSTSGAVGDGLSLEPSLSYDGRFVAFSSSATNLLPPPQDNNNEYDIYVRDRDLNVNGVYDEPGAVSTVRESVTYAGAQITGGGLDPGQKHVEISRDGRYLVYDSPASVILPAGQDTNGDSDVFLRDRQLGTTERVSLSTTGTQGTGTAYAQYPDISDDGDVIVFDSNFANLVPGDTNAKTDVFARQRSNATTVRISVANGLLDADARDPSVSGDGRYTVFSSTSSRLVPGDTNGVADIFLRDNLNGVTTRLSVDEGGGQSTAASATPVISADGTAVAFTSSAALTGDDGNAFSDIYVRTVGGPPSAIERVSVGPNGEASGNSRTPAINGDGSVIAFASRADSLFTECPIRCTGLPADAILVRNRNTLETTAVSYFQNAVIGRGADPSISLSGEVVAFSSLDQLDGDGGGRVGSGVYDHNGFSDIYVYDFRTGLPSVGVTQNGDRTTNGASGKPKVALDASGRILVAFESAGSDLLVGDTNAQTDVFLVSDLYGTDSVVRTSVTNAGGQLTFGGLWPAIDGLGRFVTFVSPYPAAYQQVYVRDTVAGRTLLASSDKDLVPGDSNSFGPVAISANGRYVTFQSEAHNLVPAGEGPALEVYTKAIPFPSIISVSPAVQGPNARFTLTVTGAGFLPGSTLVLDGDFTFTNIVVVNESTITANVGIKSTAGGGGHTVWVTLNGTVGLGSGAAAQCLGCLTVG